MSPSLSDRVRHRLNGYGVNASAVLRWSPFQVQSPHRSPWYRADSGQITGVNGRYNMLVPDEYERLPQQVVSLLLKPKVIAALGTQAKLGRCA